ncbi:MAG TPA: hypothetical protein VG328_21245 [Stellaceae bacterium]|jgi:hypothetical protein|nr:hypothetical protein [Stellaceae bacterium]
MKNETKVLQPNSAKVLRELAQQWRKAAAEVEHPQLKQCYDRRARDIELRIRAYGNSSHG